MAKRSAIECAAVLDLCSHLELVEEAKHVKGREFLLRIVAMLQFFGLGHARGLGFYPVNGY